ncbi:glycerol-3-phosphate dehydrogenase [Prunus yedoensis var. nudiflora]|uniref:Glycerol-3-phosphate dehydrogenase n=1 Tax=Prunus yedoensis var. nudiflora TaxID=2094558 RepID=A0A314YMN7_PRUYE|nr:glycerol-3-phosphate dehydrogenase [Prunus yedoensis var. nudiflora]
MAALLEPPPPFPLLPPNSNSTRPIPYNLKLGRPANPSNKPALLLSVHPPTTTTTPCCAATPEQPVSESPNPVPGTALVRTRDRRRAVRLAWEKLVRWSRSWRSKAKTDVLEPH